MINIINAIDYYPFGSTMPGRSFSTPSYRFGLNGMEKDDDLKGSGNSLDFGARIYDPRLGRWSARDKLSLKYVGLSPYTFVGNSPVLFIDPDGLQIVVPNINDRKAVLGAINKAFGEGFFTFDKSGKLNYSGKSTKELDPIQKKLFAYFSYINNNDIDTYIRLNTLHMKGKYSYNFSTEEVTFKHGNIYKLGSFGGMTGGVKYNTTDMGRTLQSAIASLYMESFVDIIITPTGMKGTTTNLEDGTQDEAGYDVSLWHELGHAFHNLFLNIDTKTSFNDRDYSKFNFGDWQKWTVGFENMYRDIRGLKRGSGKGQHTETPGGEGTDNDYETESVPDKPEHGCIEKGK